MQRTLSAIDRSWLLLESADTPVHMGALLVFTLPHGARAGYVDQLARRLRKAAPAGAPWTLQLSRSSRLNARWQDDAQPDLHVHVQQHTLPAPGGEREFGVLVERLHSEPLDLSRPLWECHLIDRLHGGRFALYCKMHPALTDAASFARLLLSTLTDTAEDDPRPPWAPHNMARAMPGAAASPTAPAPQPARVRSTAALKDAFGGAQAKDSVLGLAAAFGRLFTSRGALRGPYGAPRLALNRSIGPQRRVATQRYERARLARVADACNATEGELVLYLCASVLRRYFKEHNALPDAPLVALLPGQHHPSAFGFVSLGTQHADPRTRLDEVRASLQASREHLQALPPDAAAAYSLIAAAPYLLGQFARMGAGLLPMCNVVITSLYGPDAPRYLGAAKLEALYPMYPLLRNGALTIDCLRYAGELDVCFVGAAEELPRLQRMAVYMGQALEDLEERIATGEF